MPGGVHRVASGESAFSAILLKRSFECSATTIQSPPVNILYSNYFEIFEPCTNSLAGKKTYSIAQNKCT